jgi:lysine-N-methylase
LRIPERRLQPKSYHAFRCVGAECEDTCCIGWNVNVDKRTYEAYRDCQDPVLGPRLRELVKINAGGKSDDDYARIALTSEGCPFLEERLCSIHRTLGEHYLSNMCATYPRILNVVDDVLERSLDLACPEAARIVLTNPSPMEFDQEGGASNGPRTALYPSIRTTDDNSGKPYRYFHDIRAFIIWLLQRRADPLWKRLVILGSFCDQLHESAAAGREQEIPEVVAGYRNAVERDLFGQALNQPAQGAAHLEMIVELIVRRMTSDFTAERFRDCYREFMQGLAWTNESSMTDLGRNYAAAFYEYYWPFMSRHEYMLEHYLVSYVLRTLFPLGPSEGLTELSAHRTGRSIREECLILLIHYGIIQAILIGVAGFHKSGFGAEHVLRGIQSFAKVFDHSMTFPASALGALKAKQIEKCAALAMFLRC